MAGRPTVTDAETQAPEGNTAAQELEEVSPAVVLHEAKPEPGTECVKFDGVAGSSYTITDTQFREIGIKGFANDSQTEVSFNKLNGLLVPAKVFSDAGLKRLLRESDLSLYTVPDPDAAKSE
jgi:hypothetical protein